MQLRLLKPAVYMFQTDASTATSECRLNLLRHHMNKCCDQPAATLFSGLQTLSGGGCCIQRMNTFNIYESTTTKIEVLTAVVIRLSLGRRSVNLLPVAQRTNAFTHYCSTHAVTEVQWQCICCLQQLALETTSLQLDYE